MLAIACNNIADEPVEMNAEKGKFEKSIDLLKLYFNDAGVDIKGPSWIAI